MRVCFCFVFFLIEGGGGGGGGVFGLSLGRMKMRMRLRMVGFYLIPGYSYNVGWRQCCVTVSVMLRFHRLAPKLLFVVSLVDMVVLVLFIYSSKYVGRYLDICMSPQPSPRFPRTCPWSGGGQGLKAAQWISPTAARRLPNPSHSDTAGATIVRSSGRMIAHRD
ncbi:hypothetical protein F4824DRAFT_112017 [Ustulina deusta]|nr:hypothetical protein F4824DRAFT_112017 [Ustulina deusta]